MRLSFFGCVADAMPRHQDLSWDGFCEVLQKTHTAQTKNLAPCFSPAEYPEGKARKADRVKAIHLAVLDIDAISNADLETLCIRLESYAYAAYTTISHPAKAAKNPDAWALRVILRLDRPVLPIEWATFWSGLQEFTGNHADPQCKDPSRLYILPAQFPDDPPPMTEYHPGAPLPVALVLGTPNAPKLHTGHPVPSGGPSHDPSSVGQRIEKAKIRHRANNLTRRSDDDSQILAANLRAILAGKPYGSPGKRNRTMLSLTWELEHLFPAADPQDIADLFTASHKTMAIVDAEPPDPIATVVKAVEGARSKRLQRREENAKATDASKRMRIARTRGDGEEHPYTPEEIQTIADMHGIQVDKMAHHWILRNGSQAYFLGLQGYSMGFNTTQGIMLAAVECLAPASHIRLHEICGVGAGAKTVFRPFDAVCSDAGMFINEVVYDLRVEYSRLDYANHRLHIASAPKAPHVPTEHPQVHEWLTLLGGARAETFLQWIATVPDMTKQLCAIYLHGAQGVGKTVFAHGLSKLWQRGTPTPFSTAVSKFNYDLATCPLILVDEGFPNLPPKQLATELRTLIGGDEIRVEQKFGGSFPLLGPRRMILAANNTSLLDFKSELSHDDIEALAVRIMQVTPDVRARDVFATLTPIEFRAWQTHKIAEHVLWLAEHRSVAQAHGTRFHVQGELDDTMRQVVVDGHYTSLACQVITRYITSPQRKTERKQGLIRFGGGELLVNQEGLNEAWLDILSRGPQPPAKLGALLRSLSNVRVSRNIKTGGMVKRFWPVDLDMLATWCDSNGYMSEEILALIDAPARVELMAVN